MNRMGRVTMVGALLTIAIGCGRDSGGTGASSSANAATAVVPPQPTATARDDAATSIDVDESVARADVEFPGCDAVVAESACCVTLADGAIELLGLDSGRLCPVAATTALIQIATSLEWRGEALYTCAPFEVVRISLRDGSWESLPVPCMAITDFDDGLLVLSNFTTALATDSVRAYRNYAALLDDMPDRSYDFGWSSTRITAHSDRFYGAWHSTDSINVGDLDTKTLLGALGLERSDDWVWGMAVTDDDRLVIMGLFNHVHLFDVHTGTQLGALDVAAHTSGLACTTRRTPPSVGTPSASLPIGALAVVTRH